MESPRLILPFAFVLFVYAAGVPALMSAIGTSSLPRVSLSADGIQPRTIEQRTGEAITHDYAQAWQDLTDALNTNRVDPLNDYFTGEAKRRITQRITEQKHAGVRTQYMDAGHKVKAVFYSPDGGEMQLEDQAELDVKIFDGNRTIYSGNLRQKYLVLMTAGADRWYVRSLESVPENTF